MQNKFEIHAQFVHNVHFFRELFEDSLICPDFKIFLHHFILYEVFKGLSWFLVHRIIVQMKQNNACNSQYMFTIRTIIQ